MGAATFRRYRRQRALGLAQIAALTSEGVAASVESEPPAPPRVLTDDSPANQSAATSMEGEPPAPAPSLDAASADAHEGAAAPDHPSSHAPEVAAPGGADPLEMVAPATPPPVVPVQTDERDGAPRTHPNPLGERRPNPNDYRSQNPRDPRRHGR